MGRRQARRAAATLAFALLVASAGASPRAHAASTPEAERGARGAASGPGVSARAQALFDEGRTLMKRGRPQEACQRFEESDRLESGLGTRFHLARCYEVLGKLASAHGLFSEVAREAAARGQEERERVARERAQALEPRLARLTVVVPFRTSADLRITRDGVPISASSWGVALPVDPGEHRITASAPGHLPWSAQVEVPSEGGVLRINVPPLAEQRQPFFEPLPHKIGLAALGVGVGTIALGSVFAVQAMSKKSASDAAGCTDQSCPDEQGVALRSEAVAAGERATWAMSFGALGLGAAAALFWLVPDGDASPGERDLRLAPAVSRGGATLRLHGRF